MARKSIAKQAADLVRLYGTTDPFLICRYMDYEVEYRPLGNIRGIFHRMYRMVTIQINDELDEDASTIACAHELGHIVRRHDNNRFFLATRTQFRTNPYEIEADAFAAHLLLQEDDYQEMLQSGYSLEQIARAARMPVDMLRLRT